MLLVWIISVILFVLPERIETHQTGRSFREYLDNVFVENVRELLSEKSEIKCVQKCIAKDYCIYVNYQEEGSSNNCELIDFQGA